MLSLSLYNRRLPIDYVILHFNKLPRAFRGSNFGFFTFTPFLVFDFRVRLVDRSIAFKRCDKLRFLRGDLAIRQILQKFIHQHDCSLTYFRERKEVVNSMAHEDRKHLCLVMG